MSVMVGNVSRPLTPAPQVLRQGSVPVLRRPSLPTSGTVTPQPPVYPCPVRVIPPSGFTTPGLVNRGAAYQSVSRAAETCPSCGNVYMPDAIFCRHCGAKRESTQAYVASEASAPSYSVGIIGTTTPMAGGAATPMVAEPTVFGAAQPFSISIPAASSYVPPPAAATTYGGYTSRQPSYAPPAVQVATALSYSPPPVVPGSVQRISTPGLPAAGYVVGMPMPGAPIAASAAVAPASLTPMPPPPSALAPDLPTPVEPNVPPSLTAGIPDPSAIDRQKSSYARGLDDQLKHGTGVLAQQLKQQSDYLFALGDQKKRQYALQVDQEIKQREMELAQQHNEQLLLLQQAAQQQKSALEHQANALLLEYNQKKAQEDLAYQQYQFQKRQYETQLQYNEEMKDLQVQQQAASQQVAQQKVAIAQQAVTATQQAQQAAQAQLAARAASGASAVMAASTSYGPAPPTSYSMTVPSYSQPVYAAPATVMLTSAAPQATSSSFLPAPTSQYVQAAFPASTCPNCGNVYMQDAVFCRNCGQKRE